MLCKSSGNFRKIPYKIHGYFQNKTGFFGATHNRVVPLKIFGEHNMQNLSAAKEACLAAGVSEDDFYNAIQSFEGTSKRLQKLAENEKGIIYLDFAHSPSKVKATVEAVGQDTLKRISSLALSFILIQASATIFFLFMKEH